MRNNFFKIIVGIYAAMFPCNKNCVFSLKSRYTWVCIKINSKGWIWRPDEFNDYW